MSKKLTLLPKAFLLIYQSGAINLLMAQATIKGSWRLTGMVITYEPMGASVYMVHALQ